MPASTWTWVATSDTAWANASNWSLNGTTDVGYPQPGDTALLTGGTVTPLAISGSQLSGNTIDVSGNAVLDFNNGSSLDSASSVFGTSGTINVSGVFIDFGNIEVDGTGNTITIDMLPGSTLISNGPTEEPGHDIGLNVGQPNDFNGGTLYVTGGTIADQEIHVNGGYADVSAVFMNNDEMSINGGLLELAQQTTVTPARIQFVNGNTAVSSTLKFDNPGNFFADGTGDVLGFTIGDTIDIGANTIGTIVYSLDSYDIGTLTVENASGTAIFTTEMYSGDAATFEQGTYAVNGGTAGSFGITGSGGDWLITEGPNSSPPSSPPSISAGASMYYAAGGSGLTLDSALAVTDTESATLISATVSISAGFLSGDSLSLGTSADGITSTYDASTGLLTLSGTDSVADYQIALDSVAYAFTPGDPTSDGSDTSRTISWMVNDGTASSSVATSSVSVSFPNDPSNDILMQNTDGMLALWRVNGTSISAYGVYGANPGPSWAAVASGAFYDGDTADVVWQNNSGQVDLWQVQGTDLVGYAGVYNPGTTWHVAGTGNFYNDGQTDLVLQQDNGQVALWDMNGSTITQSGMVQYNGSNVEPGTSWNIVATGHFYSSGSTEDIVLQNTNNGEVDVWGMNGTTIAESGVVQLNGTIVDPGSAWRVAGTGDFYGDGNSGLVLQNSDGQVAIWELNGTSVSQWSMVQYDGSTANPGSSWNVVGTGDYNNDGKTDILLQNQTGQMAVWEMNGGTVSSYGIVYNPGTTWSVADDSMRFIYNQGANETLTASPAVPDDFVFTSYAPGAHTISGFNPNLDMIQFNSSQFSSFAAIEAATMAVAGGSVIDLGNGSSLSLPGVAPTALHSSTFALG